LTLKKVFLSSKQSKFRTFLKNTTCSLVLYVNWTQPLQHNIPLVPEPKIDILKNVETLNWFPMLWVDEGFDIDKVNLRLIINDDMALGANRQSIA